MKNLNFKNSTKKAFKAVYKNYLSDTNSIGVDGISNQLFSKKIKVETKTIARKLENNTYSFSLYKEKLILKGRDSKPRAISIPTNRDKLLLKYLNLVIANDFSSVLKQDSMHTIIKTIKGSLKSKKYDSFIKLDITNFFPSIEHEKLFIKLSEKITEPYFLSLIQQAIEQSTVAITDSVRKKGMNKKGVPQGLSISGQLSTIYLSGIDEKYSQSNNFQYYRFVDDILILCKQKDILSIHDDVSSDMQALGLTLHPLKKGSQKSTSAHLTEGVQFLGYYFKSDQISIRKSSIDKIYHGINKVFLKYYKYQNSGESMQKVLKKLYHKLNLKITGCVIDQQNSVKEFFPQ